MCEASIVLRLPRTKDKSFFPYADNVARLVRDSRQNVPMSCVGDSRHPTAFQNTQHCSESP
eukprot:6197870-Pleurochrysis_carterae.AAC.1